MLHVDDDSLLHVARYRDAMRCLFPPKDQGDPLLMLGHCFFFPFDAHKPRFCGGGETYSFPAALLPRIVNCRAGMTQPEDVYFSMCAAEAGATLVNNKRLRMAPKLLPGWVTAHHVKPDDVPRYYTDAASQ